MFSNQCQDNYRLLVVSAGGSGLSRETKPIPTRGHQGWPAPAISKSTVTLSPFFSDTTGSWVVDICAYTGSELSQHQNVLGYEDLELWIFQDVECSFRRVFAERGDAMDLKKIVARLHIAEVTVCES